MSKKRAYSGFSREKNAHFLSNPFLITCVSVQSLLPGWRELQLGRTILDAIRGHGKQSHQQYNGWTEHFRWSLRARFEYHFLRLNDSRRPPCPIFIRANSQNASSSVKMPQACSGESQEVIDKTTIFRGIFCFLFRRFCKVDFRITIRN